MKGRIRDLELAQLDWTSEKHDLQTQVASSRSDRETVMASCKSQLSIAMAQIEETQKQVQDRKAVSWSAAAKGCSGDAEIQTLKASLRTGAPPLPNAQQQQEVKALKDELDKLQQSLASAAEHRSSDEKRLQEQLAQRDAELQKRTAELQQREQDLSMTRPASCMS
jgi:DNA repair exonuclease SbcCD ATPase subunit